jgi:hypothetical protein
MVQSTGSGNEFYFSNSQGQVFGVVAGSASVPDFNHYKAGADGTDDLKVANRGEIAEGILGAAMFAKFTKREGSGDIGIVTPADIVGVLEKLKQTGEDEYLLKVRDANLKFSDTVEYLLRLKTAPYRDLMDPNKRAALTNEYASAAGYVNSPMAERYAKYFYLNGRPDEIAVMADGAASETERKTDVWVAVRDEAGNIRQLKLNASLKVGGVAQFGQVGGSDTESMKTLWGYFGISDLSNVIEEFENIRDRDVNQALSFMYKHVADELARELAGDNDTEEAKFVDNVAHAVTHFATLGDPNVELVDFDKGGFKILRFRDLVAKLRKVNLTASFVGGKARPELAIHDVDNPKQVLVKIRAKVENKTDKNGQPYEYVRNYIEKGKLLESITKIQQRSWKEADKFDPEATRVQIRPKTAKTASAPRDSRDKAAAPRARR